MAGRRANSFYMLAGQVVGKAGLFISLMIFSRMLDDGSFGELLLSVSIGLLVLFLSDMGVTMVVTRRLSTGFSIPAQLSSALLIRTMLSLAALMLVCVTVNLAGYSSRQILLIALVCTGFILDGFLESAFAVFRATETMIHEGLARTLNGLFGAGLAVYALLLDHGVVFAAGTYIIRVFPALLYSSMVLCSRMGFRPVRWNSIRGSLKPLLTAAVPLGLAGMIIAAGQRLDSVFIKHYLGDSAIAAYQQCLKLFEALVLIVTPTLLPGALFPALCKAVKDGWGEARERLAWMTELFLVTSFVLIPPLWAGEHHVLRFLWGDSFLRGIDQSSVSSAYRTVLLTLPVAYVFLMLMSTFIAAERQRKVLPAVSVSLVIEVLLFIILIPEMGIAGAATAHLIFLAFSLTWMALDLRKEYGATGLLRGSMRPVAAFLPSLVILIAEPWGKGTSGLASLAVFAALWLLLGGGSIIPRRRR